MGGWTSQVGLVGQNFLGVLVAKMTQNTNILEKKSNVFSQKKLENIIIIIIITILIFSQNFSQNFKILIQKQLFYKILAKLKKKKSLPKWISHACKTRFFFRLLTYLFTFFSFLFFF